VLQALADADDVINDQDPGSTNRSFSILLGDGTFLGVGTEDISKENMGRYGMREVRGVGVTEVVKDSPAEKAGLRKDDVILRFDGESVTSVRKLNRLVNESSPDQTVRLTISRGGAEQELSATLTKRDLHGLFNDQFKDVWKAQIHDDVIRGIESGFPSIQMGDGDLIWQLSGNRRIGLSTQTLTKQLADYFGVKDGGVLVTSVSDNGPAARAGLKAGDVITAIDGEKVSSPGDLARAINKKQDGDVTLTVVRDHNARTVTVTPEKKPEPKVIRPGTIGTRTITIPSITIPAFPEMNIRIPSVVVPATPQVDVTIPSRPARTVKSRGIII
jgi:serine protease Do